MSPDGRAGFRVALVLGGTFVVSAGALVTLLWVLVVPLVDRWLHPLPEPAPLVEVVLPAPVRYRVPKELEQMGVPVPVPILADAPRPLPRRSRWRDEEHRPEQRDAP